AFAEELVGIEFAARGVFKDTVLRAVICVAGGEHSFVDYGVFRGGDVGGLVLVGGLFDPHGLRGAAGPVEARGAGDNAVEIVGIALGFHHGGAAAGGATGPVRVFRGACVERGDDGFRGDGHFVGGAVAVVN